MKSRLYLASLVWCMLLCAFALASDPVTVDYVVDGDTFVLTTGEKVRMIGIDAPESADPNKPVEYFADESKAHLKALIQGRQVTLESGPEKKDKYGRILAYVRLADSTDANLRMIEDGYAMAYLRFSHPREDRYAEAEKTARKLAIGMWASPRSAPPAEAKKSPPPKAAEKEADVTVYVTRTGSKYHRGSCGYLSKSKIPMSKKAAIAAGYGPCSRCRP